MFEYFTIYRPMQIRRHHDVGPSWPRLSTDQDDCKFVVKDHPITVFAHCFQIRTTVFDEKTFYRFLLFICHVFHTGLMI